ncbi:hypothetical protein PCHDK_000563100, partial [Plasmodium chabaudi adami]
QGSPEGGTTDTKSVQDGVSDDQISNGTQGGANKSQQGTSGGPGVPGVPGSVSGGGQGSKVGDSGTGAGGASGDTESSSTGSEHLDNGSHDQDSGSDAGDKKGLPIGPNPRTLSLTSGANKEGSNDGEGNRNNEPSNGGGEDGGQDDQKSQDGLGSESRPGNEQNPTDIDTGEKGPKNTSGTSFDFKPYIFSIPLKGVDQLNKAINFYNANKEKIKEAIDTIKNLYNTYVSNIQNIFYKFTEFINNFINNLSIDPKQVENPPDSGDNPSGSGGTGSGSPAPDDPSQPQKGSDKQDSQTTENSKGQTQEQKQSPGTSGNQNSDRTNQEGPQKSEPAPVLKPEHSGSELKGNGITEIGDIYILKEYKKIVISIIVILIPITLTILYKYLSFGRRNELKKKNNMKKVINMVGVNKTTKTVINSSDGKKQIQIIIKSSKGPQKSEPAPVLKPEHSGSELKGNGITEIGDIYILKEYKKIVISIIVILIPITLTILYKYLSFGRRNELKKKNNMKKVINMVGVNKTTKTVINSSDGKKQIQIIIKSSSQKKQTKKSINSDYGEKSPSLNIYQLMQADPVPFINLFFLLIFFVYKRKRDFIE